MNNKTLSDIESKASKREGRDLIAEMQAEIDRLTATIADLTRRIELQNEARRRNGRRGGRPRLPASRLSAAAKYQRARRQRLAQKEEE